MADKKTSPKEPHFKTADAYVAFSANQRSPYPSFFGTINNYLQDKITALEWTQRGWIRTWFTKYTVTNADNGKAENKDVCIRNRALVRDDGKIISGIDKIKHMDCSLCEYFAENVNGYLRGVEATGFYVYK